MRREQREAAARLDQVARDGPREREAVEGRRAAADFVHQHQDSRVAPFRIAADSVISTMNVERPRARSSAAPMRVKMRSIGPIVALVAGT